MKKFYLLLLLGILLLPITVFAAGTASISGPSTVENGSNVKVTVTVKNTTAWSLKLSGSGATSGCSNTVADVTADGNNTTKTFSVTCKATSIGTINFKAVGDITSSDGANSNVLLSKSVTVVAPRPKETEPRLNSLSVDNYDIGFNKDKTSYSITVEPTISSINIRAKAISGYASISGTGSKSIDSDENKFVVTCTAENGTKKEYTINVSVKDNNPIIATINGEKYIVYKTNKSLIAPTNYADATIKIGDFEVPAYTNETTKLTIVGVKSSEGNIKYAIYDEGKYSLYNENKSNSLLLYISDKELEGYTKTIVTINEVKYTAYELDERFVIVYAMNINTGKFNYYKYDKNDNTFQYYDVIKESKKSEGPLFIISTIVFAIISVVSVVYIIFTKFYKKRRNTKK